MIAFYKFSSVRMSRSGRTGGLVEDYKPVLVINYKRGQGR